MNQRINVRMLCIVLFLVFISFIMSGCSGNNKDEKNTSNEPETVTNAVEETGIAAETEYEDNSSPSDAISAYSNYYSKYGWGSVLEERLIICAKEAGYKTIDHANIETMTNEGDYVSGTYHHYDLIFNGTFNGYDGFGNYAGRVSFECKCSITYDMKTDTYSDMDMGTPKVVE